MGPTTGEKNLKGLRPGSGSGTGNVIYQKSAGTGSSKTGAVRPTSCSSEGTEEMVGRTGQTRSWWSTQTWVFSLQRPISLPPMVLSLGIGEGSPKLEGRKSRGLHEIRFLSLCFSSTKPAWFFGPPFDGSLPEIRVLVFLPS